MMTLEKSGPSLFENEKNDSGDEKLQQRHQEEICLNRERTNFTVGVFKVKPSMMNALPSTSSQWPFF
jgi:hypothetical protein